MRRRDVLLARLVSNHNSVEEAELCVLVGESAMELERSEEGEAAGERAYE
jgi:hypothetical protein